MIKKMQAVSKTPLRLNVSAYSFITTRGNNAAAYEQTRQALVKQLETQGITELVLIPSTELNRVALQARIRTISTKTEVSPSFWTSLCHFAFFADSSRDRKCRAITATRLDLRGSGPLDGNV